MNICIISVVMPGNSKGGIEDHTFMLSRNLSKLGHAVSVITAASPNKEYEEVNGVKIHYLKKAKPKKFTKNYSKEWKTESLKKFLGLHEENKFDVIHSQEESALHFIKKRINKKYDIPIITTLHTTVYDNIKTRINMGISRTSLLRDVASVFWCPFYWSKSYLLKELTLAKGSDGLIATSDQQEEIFKDIYKAGRLFKAYNGIDANLFKPEKKSDYNKFGIQKKDRIILAVARLERDKGIQYLIGAMPEICKNTKNCKLVVVGDGLYKNRLMNLQRKSKVKDKIIFTGFLDIIEVKNLLNRCDVFVNPTIRCNGYDLIMAEAMACEKVVISSNIGSTPTLIEDGRDGILFETKNMNQLIEKINFILNDKKLTKIIGKSAREKILKDFTSESMAKRTVQVYKEVIKKC